ncbi:GNAT family N-acetyltransferase [Exiguobacterium aurantiacum]|uniref:GNAT family N-acetyltransferase n=1 Tax=Exiguobacterium aurantiacum TaxID=33987 RepID=A0ABY5FPM4_9BACL|nr:GNAT family N-acetyltransferase [Exiguobacterium aurantiacum]UTT43172.1 GNAT family N-acetyltransferase [Exiguobacterium aurantiacum]
MDIRPMTRQDARAIQAWAYESPYDFYNQDASVEGLDELMAYQAVHDGALIGFYCLGRYAQVPNDTYIYDDAYIDIGIGMHPDRTGRGHGRTFVRLVMREAAREGKPLRLTVAAFNQRAIHLYEQLGFQHVASFERSEIRFLVMTQ